MPDRDVWAEIVEQRSGVEPFLLEVVKATPWQGGRAPMPDRDVWAEIVEQRSGSKASSTSRHPKGVSPKNLSLALSSFR